jgi:hypothetical protein
MAKIDIFHNVPADTSSLTMTNCDATNKDDIVVLGICSFDANPDLPLCPIPINSISGSTVNVNSNWVPADGTLILIQSGS